MSIKNLFSKTSVISNKSLSDLTQSYTLESVGILSESLQKQDLLLPHVDFSKPEQFVKYGSAERYYRDSIIGIYTNYPWDGSKKQKQNWRNNASYLDLYLFDNEFPKETGSITIGTNFGTASVKSNGFYSTPARVEYIKIKPGLSSGSKYDENNDRVSAFSFNSETGFCVEFWMKANTWSADLATASFQCIFDMGARDEDTTSSLAFDSPGAWRFSILISSSNSLVTQLDDGLSNYENNNLNAVSFNEWNHYSINVLSGGYVETWKNNKKLSRTQAFSWPYIPISLTFSGTIGAFSTIPNSWFNSQGAILGWNKFSGSLDDFRFWRRSRTDKEIALNYFSNVDGGFDNDELLNPDMGFYYKFNEGTTQTSSYDSVVLDYSGRRNNGSWIGYTSSARSTTSAISNEQGDPIIYSSSYRIVNLLSSKELIGANYDFNNTAAILNNLPGFAVDEDNGELAKLTQIIASYFDKLWLQISSLTTMRDMAYFTTGSLSSEILMKALQSNGIPISNIFDSYTLLQLIGNKSEFANYEQSIETIKQVIYKNLYNNLIYIFKSKGTEKAIKSVFRSFGVDDEVLKIKTYTNSTFEIDGSKKFETVRRKNFLDLSGQTDAQNQYGTIFNYYTSSQSGSIGFISNGTNHQFSKLNPWTLESTIIFPKTFNSTDENYVSFPDITLSSSLFGFYQLTSTLLVTSQDTTWLDNGFKFNAFAVKKSKNSKDAKFVFHFSGSNMSGSSFSEIISETDWYENVYDDSKWTFAIRLYKTGSDVNVPIERSGNFSNVFHINAINELGGQIIHTYSNISRLRETNTINTSGYAPFQANTACYVGALRTNFTGTVIRPTNVKISSLRLWNDRLSDDTLLYHAYDAHNFGTSDVYKSFIGNSVTVTSSLMSGTNIEIPKFETPILNWDFEKIYTPNSSGQFEVYSFRGQSSLSQTYSASFGGNYTALGYGFNSGAQVIDKNYVIEQKNAEIENLVGHNSVQVLDSYDEFFATNIRPTEYFYTIENSIYSVISEEILNFFSSINDFSNLIGEPYLRYQQKYKKLEHLRQLFFNRLINYKIDLNKYMSYYIWLDSAISSIIRSLFPLSANVDTNIRCVIESHVLERNKHTWPYQLIRSKPNKSIIGKVKPLFKKFNALEPGRITTSDDGFGTDP